MPCVNNRYTPDELESIFLWDCICEALPLTLEERWEINRRDALAKNGYETGPSNAGGPCKNGALTPEERRKKKQEYDRRYRAAHREQIRAYDAAYRAANRDSINERQREYDKTKRADKGLA